MEQYQHILERLKKKEIILFLGAGVSLSSGAPLVSQIYDKIWEQVDLSETEKQKILSRNFSFEFFIAILMANCSMINFFKMFDPKEGANIHILINYLVSKGYIKNIITTNFDTLIETNITSKKVNVYEGEQILNANLVTQEVNVFKIHGTIDNIDELKIDIKGVANRTNIELVSSFSKKILSEAQERIILFLGYSFSDHHDINPALNELLENKSTITVLHTDDIKYNGSINIKYATFDFLNSNSQVYALNTDDLINYLFDSLELPIICHSPSFDWRIHFDHWLEEPLNMNSSALFNTIATLFTHLGYTKEATVLLERALKVAEITNDSLWEVSIKVSLGANYLLMGKINKAKKILIDVIEKNKDFGWVLAPSVAKAYCNYSLVLLTKKNYSEAMTNCYKAMNIATIYNLEQEYYENYCNLGLILVELDCVLMGRVYVETAARYSQQVGDTASLARRFGYLADIYFKEGAYKEAKNIIQEALNLAQLTGEYTYVPYMVSMRDKIDNIAPN